jgi:hypothetical protein
MSEQFELVCMATVEEVLEQSKAPEKEWLWCIFCERFFQADFLRFDYLGNWQGCAFCECAGFECAIFVWDTFQGDDDIWPESISDLRHGLRLSPPAVEDQVPN